MEKLNAEKKGAIVAGWAPGPKLSYWGGTRSFAMIADTLGMYIDEISDIAKTFNPTSEKSLADVSGTSLGRSPLRYRYGNSPTQTMISTGFF